MNEDDYEVPTRPVLPDDPGEATVHGWSDAPVAGDRVDVHMGPIIAGDPGGARVEVTGDGLHAYDSTGVETARIQGEGGEFVGGEFRTSDSQAGRVTLADGAFTDARTGIQRPGISIESVDSDDIATPGGVGPSERGAMLSGGIRTDGSYSTIEVDRNIELRARRVADDGGNVFVGPDEVNATLWGPDGAPRATLYAGAAQAHLVAHGDDREEARVLVDPTQAYLSVSDSDGEESALVFASWDQVNLRSHAGGTKRNLLIDANGVWVGSTISGSQQWYNLEETAQDSGWQAFSTVAGMDSYALAWRNKGGVIYMRGTVTTTWSAGWTTVATNLPVEMRPAIRVVRQAPSTSEQGLYFRMGNDGVLEFNKPTAGTRTADLSAIFYPAD